MKKPIKIAYIVTSYQSFIRILDAKLCALDKFESIDIAVISSPQESSSPVDSLKDGVPPIRHIPLYMSRRLKPLTDLKSIWQLYNVLRREKFDIVHSHTSKAGFITAVAAKMAKVPFICHTHHGLPFFEGQDRKSYFFYRFLEKIACKFRDYLFSQNKHDMAECIKLMGSESKVSYEGNGVDVNVVNAHAKEQLSQVSKGFWCEGVRILLVSRLMLLKRVEDFFKVIQKLKQEGLKVSCVQAGTGELEEQLKKQLTDMELDEYINMVGFVNYIPGLIATSDIVMLCSEKEGIPRSLIEAMALRKPVVATDVLGTQELVVNNKTGFLVPLGDIDAMAERVKLLAAKPELRKEMGTRGFDRVNEHFNDIKIADFLHEFYISKIAELKKKNSPSENR